MKISQTIKTPTMPNFLIIEDTTTGKKQDGFKELPKIPISELTDEQAVEFGELMKQTFINHHKKSKKKVNG